MKNSTGDQDMMQTEVQFRNSKWGLEFKTPSMDRPKFWPYDSEEEAIKAEARLNPSKLTPDAAKGADCGERR